MPIEETLAEKTTVEDEDKDNDEAVVEEAPEDNEEIKAPKTKTVVVDKWSHLNSAPPLWQRCVGSAERLENYFNKQLHFRDPKDVPDEEYRLFYQNTFKDFKDPLAWHHFSGDSDDGVAFKAIVYVPSAL